MKNPKTSLRAQIIKLAYEEPGLRSHLIPILKSAKKGGGPPKLSKEEFLAKMEAGRKNKGKGKKKETKKEGDKPKKGGGPPKLSKEEFLAKMQAGRNKKKKKKG